MSDHGTIRVGVVGLGFMGCTHWRAYEGAREAGYPCSLVAACDRDASRRAGRIPAGGTSELGGQSFEQLFDPQQVRAYTSPEELLADPDVDLVSICTYTDTHPDLAIAALDAGKHVLVEKPVAVEPAEVQRVIESAAAHPELRCMPAMCIRFWPGWSWLRRAIDEQTYGPVRAATFQRLGTRPDWGEGFYEDDGRCGAALVDLHLHDADMIRWCFGPPNSVFVTGSPYHFTAAYAFADGPAHVTAEGSWLQAPGTPFRMRFVVNFAEATADFDLSRDPPLMLGRDGAFTPVPIEPLTGYDLEVRHMIDLITGGAQTPTVTLADARAVAELLQAERESLERGERIRL
jgi:predicted dehydrogenase